MENKRKIINDPVYGFIQIGHEILFDLIEHPWFQRLRRIRQLGLTHLVYPGALHTRFQHSLGAMHLMGEALRTIETKGHKISSEDKLAAQIAILLHDIGHGPFSHALEFTIIRDTRHESMSKLLMDLLNHQYQGQLTTAISIFNNTHPRKFLSQLVAGQLDVDRLDYLSRDSFFTGVSEGVIGTQRIIKMLNIYNNKLVAEEKGIHSIEKFILARRIMYWQVYLHKTVLAAENLMILILRRARYLSQQGEKLFASPALSYFLSSDGKPAEGLQEEFVDKFTQLDDFDILSAIKVWTSHPDPILSYLASSLIRRNLPRCLIQPKPFDYFYVEKIKEKIRGTFGIKEEDLQWFFVSNTTSNFSYRQGGETIELLLKSGKVAELTEMSDQFSPELMHRLVIKHFICFPREVSPL
ncbi:MAG: HD domain-containing protein [Bacteroidales bacterium]